MTIRTGPGRLYWAPVGTPAPRRAPRPKASRCRTTSGRFRAGTKRNRRRERVHPWPRGWRYLGVTDGIELDA